MNTPKVPIDARNFEEPITHVGFQAKRYNVFWARKLAVGPTLQRYIQNLQYIRGLKRVLKRVQRSVTDGNMARQQRR